ncbi:hypothetical protein OGATHE_004590 [Ogataea polymorpha]|uniref:Uncharacterized protein n=1 Tax=Ogataea polymorpha TaxID=460523 RepID=A0A9P8P1M0_9ASCO|nr:hypothetical protein OGATHE_004590 [Ogataea polymorpha]
MSLAVFTSNWLPFSLESNDEHWIRYLSGAVQVLETTPDNPPARKYPTLLRTSSLTVTSPSDDMFSISSLRNLKAVRTRDPSSRGMNSRPSRNISKVTNPRSSKSSFLKKVSTSDGVGFKPSLNRYDSTSFFVTLPSWSRSTFSKPLANWASAWMRYWLNFSKLIQSLAASWPARDL